MNVTYLTSPRCAVRTRRPSSLGAALHRCSWCTLVFFKKKKLRHFPRCARRHLERNSNAEQSCGFKATSGMKLTDTMRHSKSVSDGSSGSAVAPVCFGFDVFRPPLVMHEQELCVSCRDVHGLEREQSNCPRTELLRGALSMLAESQACAHGCQF